ncbi:polymeric immunoglobulin receptor-like [Sinocyclocheilus rhinocerous]|uniref:polymeric immunoglobulin receptor-like n=1 Tax=Sinocyclocheilus rhinocerous TaxID=307959 RepID=UPI0007B960FD|nr:PREDICTED: polymeric immunoglobulin receptor-like [Sinocyclocheilus rhinocerous]
MKIIWTFTLLMIPGVMSSISVRGYSGGGVIITCRYYEGYTDNAKYFCRGQKKITEWCSELIKTDKKNGGKWVDSGRFSLFDDTRAAVFTVTFRDLSEQDSDTYYCAVDISGIIDSYTEVNLNVVTGEQISAVRGYSGGNIIINYKYEMNHENHEKYFCVTGSYQCITLINTDRAAEWKHVGRFSVHDDRSARLLRVFIRELNVDDSGEHKIIVKVSEDYSLFSEFKLDVKKGELLSFVSHTGCDYEEIKDSHKQLPTNPSDSPNAVYATAQLPTNPSVSANCVYSTVQEATGDSQIFITCAEDLNYAVVNFHKKADCPDRVSLRNNQDCSEYAAVNHLTA